MDMLKKDNIPLLVLLLFLLACGDKHKKQNYTKIDFDNDPVKEYQILNFHKYKHIYDACNDSLISWRKDSLAIIEGIMNYPYQLDSAFCFNSNSNRFITTVNSSNIFFKDKAADVIQEFGGAKIKNKWYFFFLGGTMIVPREYYRDSIYINTPLTFAELSWIAHKNVFNGAIIKNKDGSFSPNDKFFEDTFNDQNNKKNIGLKIEDHDTAIVNNVGRKYKYKLKEKDFKEFYDEIKKDKLIQ
jgi:hypothetical protein